MEKIIALVKSLIVPKEKEGNHLDHHVQINTLFWAILEQFSEQMKMIENLKELINNANRNADNIGKKMEDVKFWINENISKTKEYIENKVEEANKKEYFFQRYEGIISTSSENDFVLDTISPVFKWPYRAEITNLRKTNSNENVENVFLPSVGIFKWEVSPKITLKSKWGKAVYEYDFDVLVTKL
jgi:hypothetical protein